MLYLSKIGPVLTVTESGDIEDKHQSEADWAPGLILCYHRTVYHNITHGAIWERAADTPNMRHRTGMKAGR